MKTATPASSSQTSTLSELIAQLSNNHRLYCRKKISISKLIDLIKAINQSHEPWPKNSAISMECYEELKQEIAEDVLESNDEDLIKQAISLELIDKQFSDRPVVMRLKTDVADEDLLTSISPNVYSIILFILEEIRVEEPGLLSKKASKRTMLKALIRVKEKIDERWPTLSAEDRKEFKTFVLPNLEKINLVA